MTMSLPPGHIRLKRQREDEPVDTLYIQPDDQNVEIRGRKKFADYIFKRVKKKDGSAAASNPPSSISSFSPSPSPSHGHLRAASAAAALRSQHPKPAATTAARNREIPSIKPTTADPKIQKNQPESVLNQNRPISALDGHSSSSLFANLSTFSLPSSHLKDHNHHHSASPSLNLPSATSSTPPSYLNLRKFHLATSSIHRHADSSSTYSVPTSASASKVDLLHRSNSAISKRKSGRDKWSTTAVVIEKKVNQAAKTTTASQDGKLVEDILSQLQNTTVPTPSRPRKRPIINEAEKKFRQQQQEILKARKERDEAAAAAAAAAISQQQQPSEKKPKPKPKSYYDQDKLAHELEQIALQMASYAQTQSQDTYLPMPVSASTTTTTAATAAAAATNSAAITAPETTSKPKLKYQPKPVVRRESGQRKLGGDDVAPATIGDALASGVAVRNASTGEYVTSTAPRPFQPTEQTGEGTETKKGAEEAGIGGEEEEDDDGEYVYDIFIRQPIDHSLPQAETQCPAGLGSTPELLPRNVGVVVITDEDAPYWEEYFDTGGEEDEVKDWASEDEDSNAEDYYANEYPEEEDSEDEDRERRGLWYDDDDDDDDDYEKRDAYVDSDFDSDYGNRFGGYRPGIRDFSDDDEGYY